MNTSNKKLIAIAVGVVLLLVLFFGKGLLNKSSGSQSASEIVEQALNGDDSKMSGSIFDLAKRGSTVKCTYSSDVEGSKMSGTTYVAGQRMRTDSSIMIDGKAMESHMISDGEWVYTWSSAMPQGIKMKLDAVDPDEYEGTSEAPKSAAIKDFQNDFDFNCTRWTADNSMFNLPSGVEFTDFSQMMNNFNSGGSSACAACDYVQDADAKAQCRQSLGCN